MDLDAGTDLDVGLIRSVVSPWTGEFPSMVPGRKDSNSWEV